MSPMNLTEWLNTIMPLLLAKSVTKVEYITASGAEVKAYWAGTIIRIDIKP